MNCGKILRAMVVAIWTLFLLQICFAVQLEQSVKAAFIYNFTKYVTWPAKAFDSGSSPIVIGIVGQDSLGGALEVAVNGKTVEGRPLVVRHLHWGQDLTGCHVLFVPGGEQENAAALKSLAGKPILIVGESSGFTHRAGIINFVIQSSRVRFEINDRAAKDRGLSISSKLLSLGI